MNRNCDKFFTIRKRKLDCPLIFQWCLLELFYRPNWFFHKNDPLRLQHTRCVLTSEKIRLLCNISSQPNERERCYVKKLNEGYVYSEVIEHRYFLSYFILVKTYNILMFTSDELRCYTKFTSSNRGGAVPLACKQYDALGFLLCWNDYRGSKIFFLWPLFSNLTGLQIPILLITSL